MAEIELIKVTELPAATEIGDADELLIAQEGASKKVAYSVVKSGVEDALTPDTTLTEAGKAADARAVGQALATKANQAEVTQALAGKASTAALQDVETALNTLTGVVATKADQTVLEQKADKTTVAALRDDVTTLNTNLAQKADKSELTSQIAGVYAELATKANTNDVNNQLAGKANIASPTFTGSPKAPTAAKGTNTTQLATTAFVQRAIADKQDTLTFDTTPTEGSTNPVTSGGVYTAVESAKADAEEAATEAKNIALGAYAAPTASGQLITLTDGADSIPAKKLTLNLSPHQSGSGDPSPENVRSISGYQSVKVVRTGKNLLKNTLGNLTQNGITFTKNADGTVTANGTATGAAQYQIPIAVGDMPTGEDLYFSGCPSGGSLTAGYDVYVWDLTVNARCKKWDGVTPSGSDVGGTTLNQVRFEYGHTATLVLRAQTGAVLNNLTFKPMIRYKDADDTFEPYQGETYDITLPTAAWTVYGGSLEINEDGTGTLTVDTGYLKVTAASDFAETGSYTEGTNGNRCGFRVKGNPFERGAECHCNIAKTDASVNSGTSSNWIPDTCYLYNSHSSGWGAGSYFRYIFPTTVTSGAEALQYLIDNGCEFTYKLHDPQTYTLTASQVETLLGNNTLWMDADGTVSLTYRADTALYVEKRIAEVQALILENNG